jgi:hypothetical protein
MTNSDKNQVTDPGRTPGQAEGVDEGEDQSGRLPDEPAMPSQAEGDLETVEEDLGEKQDEE